MTRAGPATVRIPPKVPRRRFVAQELGLPAVGVVAPIQWTAEVEVDGNGDPAKGMVLGDEPFERELVSSAVIHDRLLPPHPRQAARRRQITDQISTRVGQ